MQFDYIIKILNLQDKNVSIDNIELINNTYFIHIKITNITTCCKHCGSTSIINHANYIRSIKYLNLIKKDFIVKTVKEHLIKKFLLFLKILLLQIT